MMSTALDIRTLKEAARGQWARILPSLSIDVPDNPKKHAPCPACGGEDRFRFDDRDGDGTYYCNQATKQSGDGFDLIRHVRGCDLKEAMQLVSDVIGGYSLAQHGAHTNGTKKMNGATIEKPVAVRKTPPDGIIGQTLFRYEDGNGLPAFYVQRIERLDGSKTFPQWGPSADGQGWQANMDHAVKPKPLYRLPAILSNSDALIFIHEGEKAAEHHLAAGLPGIATTCSGGAGKAHLTDLSPLTGRVVVILPDNDAPGEQHAQDIAERALKAGAASVRILRLPDLPPKGDVVEWLEAGGRDEEFAALLAIAGGTIWTESRTGCYDRLTD